MSHESLPWFIPGQDRFRNFLLTFRFCNKTYSPKLFFSFPRHWKGSDRSLSQTHFFVIVSNLFVTVICMVADGDYTLAHHVAPFLRGVDSFWRAMHNASGQFRWGPFWRSREDPNHFRSHKSLVRKCGKIALSDPVVVHIFLPGILHNFSSLLFLLPILKKSVKTFLKNK